MHVTLRVEGMTCQHCERAVTQAIQAQDPAATVAIDLAAGTVRAETRLSPAAVAALVAAEGYRVLAS